MPINTASPSAGQPPVTSIPQQPLPLTTCQEKLALAVLNKDSTGDIAVISLILHDNESSLTLQYFSNSYNQIHL